MSSPSRVLPLSRLILCVLAITVPLAQSAESAESADISDGADLARQVAALPTAQPWQRLKQATLNWALEDARAAETQGFAERSAATLADVRTLLAQEIGKAKAPEANYFPAIPGFASNPVAQDAVKRLTTLIISPDTFVKGPAGDDITTKGSGTHNAIMRAEEGLQLVQALCHPQSPFLDDPRIIAPLFRRMEYSYEYFVPGNNRVADFAISPPAAQMYLLFTAVHPDLILPSRRAAWEHALRVNSDGIMALREKVFAASALGTSYVNADIKYITALAYAGLLFHEPRYLKAAEAGVRLQETALYGDGGFAYIYWQNECFTYHGIAVSELARLWQVTGWPMAKQLIERTRTYYPLSIEPSGIAEFTTASAWKHNWSGAKPGRDALITAAFTNDPHNQRLALMDLGKGDLWSASFWRPDITPAPSPDQYLVHDRNIDGPRGRFGAWSFSGTSRDYHDDPRGKSTYVGCVAAVPAGQAMTTGLSADFPMSAALDVVGCEVLVQPGVRNERTALRLSRQEQNAVLVSSTCAALSTRHRLSPYGGAASDWQQTQSWLFTRERLIGMVAVEALSKQTACSISTNLQFVTARHERAPRQEIIFGDQGTFTYGLLEGRIHQQDYALRAVDYPDQPRPGKFARLVLSDRTDDSTTTYPAGTRHMVLVEVHPQWQKPATTVTALTISPGLVAFEVIESENRYQLVANPGTDAASYTIPTTWSGALLHRSGEQYRPGWIATDGREEQHGPAAVTATVGDVVVIPAGAHLLLEARGK